MGRSVARADRAAGRVVQWLDEHYLGPILRVTSALIITLLPAAQAYSGTTRSGWLADVVRRFSNPAWLILFFAALVTLVPLQHYHGGSVRRRLMLALARVNGSFAGSLLSFGHKFDATKHRKLDDAQCEALCAALLHRIRDLAAIALGVEATPRLRATLAVPYSTTGTEIDAMRVWCYDETHGDRGFTVIPMVLNGDIAPGAPAAYITKEFQVISDIRRVPVAGPRPYRSILSLPLSVNGPDGKPLAVVSIDADEPNFFDDFDVAQEIRPLVSPAVTAIGLVLLSRRTKGPYVFPK